MELTSNDLTSLGAALMMGGITCALIWLFFQLLWAIGLGLFVAGLVLFISGKAKK